MKKYVIGNWKANKTLAEVQSWKAELEISAVLQMATTVEIVLCPPSIYLPELANTLPSLKLGVQTVSPYPQGAYTGAVAASQLSQWASYALLGHAERRKHFGETSVIVAQQVRQALDAKMTPIIAVDDSNWMEQLTLLEKSELQSCLVMYEPPTAISSAAGEKPADLPGVIEAIAAIREDFVVLGVLYGGSVSASNVSQYLSELSIDGVVPGKHSLVAADFIALVTQAHVALSSL